MCRWNTPTAATRLATSHVRSITCAGTLLRSKPRSAAWPIGIASRACPTGSAFARRWCWPLRAAPAARSLRTRWPCSRSTWTARLAGNEFAVLRRGADAATAHATALRITQSFEEPLAFEDQTVDLSAGIGIACWPGDADDADTLLSRSEIAMYAAKRRLSGAQQYDASFDSASAQTLSLLTELRHAVEHHELRLYLQPKVPLRGPRGGGAEALVRWQHPQRGLVPPMQFIPFAEQTGFVRQLTLWMFEEVGRLLADPRTQGLALRVSVNLSTRDLLDPELSTRLADILVRHGVPASAFCLEITESAIMDDPQRAEAMLNRLSEQGFKLSIDDFGTGYSSLAYPKRLPVHELKIDKSFVMGMETGEDDAMIVRSTIDLAHNLGLTVVAEGVETAAARCQGARAPQLPHGVGLVCCAHQASARTGVRDDHRERHGQLPPEQAHGRAGPVLAARGGRLDRPGLGEGQWPGGRDGRAGVAHRPHRRRQGCPGFPGAARHHPAVQADRLCERPGRGLSHARGGIDKPPHALA